VAGATAAAPFGTGATVRAGSNIPGITFAGTTITIPNVGRYLVAVTYISGTISTSPSLTASTGVSIASTAIMNNNGNALLAAVTTNAGGVAIFICDVTAPNGLITMSGGGTYTAGNTDVFVCQLSSGLTKPRVPETLEELRTAMAAILNGSQDEKGLLSEHLRRPHQIISVDSKGEEESVDVKEAVPNTPLIGGLGGILNGSAKAAVAPVKALKKGFFSA